VKKKKRATKSLPEPKCPHCQQHSVKGTTVCLALELRRRLIQEGIPEPTYAVLYASCTRCQERIAAVFFLEATDERPDPALEFFTLEDFKRDYDLNPGMWNSKYTLPQSELN
jgi:hypothetical protein